MEMTVAQIKPDSAAAFNEALAEKLVARAVRRKLGMFAAFPDLDKDDLIAEMLTPPVPVSPPSATRSRRDA
jgi:hypothetical protein